MRSEIPKYSNNMLNLNNVSYRFHYNAVFCTEVCDLLSLQQFMVLTFCTFPVLEAYLMYLKLFFISIFVMYLYV